MDRRAAQQNSGSAPPAQSTAAPRPSPPASSTAAPPPPPPSSSSVVRPSTGSSSPPPPATSSATETLGSSVALPISSTSVGTQQSTNAAGPSVVVNLSSTINRGTVPRGPSDLPSSSGTATINSTEDNAWTDTVVAITWGSIGGVILLVIGILVWRNKRRHDKEDPVAEAETYHPPVLRHPPRPSVPSGQYALSATQLEQVQAQDDMRLEQEAAMGFHVPFGQPGSRFSIISQNGSSLAAPPTLMYVSRPPNSDSNHANGSGPHPILHRMASAPVMLRPMSYVGSSTPVTGTPTSNPGGLSPMSGMSADSSPYPHSAGAYPVPVYMIPVSSAGQMDPSFAYATMNHHPNWASGGVQYAQTLPLNAGHHHHHTEPNKQHGVEVGLGIASGAPEPIAEESEKAQGALIPEADNPQRRPSTENVRHRQTGGSPQSATFEAGYLPHSSSTYSLRED